MTRATIIAVAAGATIGYLAHEPSVQSLLLSAVVAVVGWVASRHLQDPGTSAERQPDSNPLADEIARARRFQRHLSVVALRDIDPSDGPLDVRSLAALGMTRLVDRALSDETTTFLLLPETDRHGALVVAQRIESKLGPASVRVAVATFPNDAATGTGLIDVAVGQLDSDTLPGSVRTVDSIG